MMPQTPPAFRMSLQLKILCLVGIALGIVAFRLLSIQDGTRAWFNYLIGALMFLGFGLAGLFFTAIQHITSARWSVGIRRIMEAMALTIPIGVVLIIALWMTGLDRVYEWANATARVQDRLIHYKAAYLNGHWMEFRMVICFILWTLATVLLVRNSFKQDQTRDARLTRINARLSGPILVMFALSVCLAAFDMLMSVEPHFFSTIFGVYYFAGFFEAGLAMIFILALILFKSGTLKGFITKDHFHDIGRFIFAFSIFWAYIGFAQYMLIWYGNLPEEAFFFKIRTYGDWGWVGFWVLMIRFCIPFLILLPFAVKRNFKLMLGISLLTIFGEWLDLFWIAMPGTRLIQGAQDIAGHIGWKELGMGIGFVCLFLLVIGLIMERIRMVPIGDPRLEASIHYYHHG